MRIGFIGLGNMGTPLATNLLKAGHSLTVHDARKEAGSSLLENGATWAASPRDVALASEVVMTCLPGPAEVEQVALGPNGIIEGIEAGMVYIDHTSNSPTLVRRIHRQFQEKGAGVLDACVGGRAPLAWERKLVVMVGGEQAVFERCRPLLEAIGDRVVYCGGVGNGMICKLVHNCINVVFKVAVGEGFTLGVKAGVDAKTLWEIVRRGITAGGSEINHTMRNTWLAGKFDDNPTSFLKVSYKDTFLATELGREYQVPMPISNLAMQQQLAGLNRGWGDMDSNSLLLLQEEAAGVEVRVPEFMNP